MAKTKVAKKVDQSSSDSSDSSDSSSDEAPAKKVQTPKQTVEKEIPKAKKATKAVIPPKPVPTEKFPKRKAKSSSSSDSSDEEPPVKKANVVEPSPVKKADVVEPSPVKKADTVDLSPVKSQPQPAVNVNVVNSGQARRHPSAYTRIPNTTPSNGPAKSQDREWWGNNVKGKKFRKEKGKKKRCQYSGAKIDGSVRSFRLDSR